VGSRSSGLSTDIARSVASRFGEGVVGVNLAVETVQTLAASIVAKQRAEFTSIVAGSGPPSVAVV
jgi:hypothetical protein